MRRSRSFTNSSDLPDVQLNNKLKFNFVLLYSTESFVCNYEHVPGQHRAIERIVLRTQKFALNKYKTTKAPAGLLLINGNILFEIGLRVEGRRLNIEIYDILS